MSAQQDIILPIDGKDRSFCGLVDTVLKKQGYSFIVEGEFELEIVDDRKVRG